MRYLMSFAAVLVLASASYAQLHVKPQTPTPEPLIREAFMPKGGDVLLSYPMDSKLGGKPIWLWKYHRRKLTDLIVTTAGGEKLSDDKVRQALSKPSIVLLSSDGEPVHPYYLNVIKPGTLVIIDKARTVATENSKSDANP